MEANDNNEKRVKINDLMNQVQNGDLKVKYKMFDGGECAGLTRIFPAADVFHLYDKNDEVFSCVRIDYEDCISMSFADGNNIMLDSQDMDHDTGHSLWGKDIRNLEKTIFDGLDRDDKMMSDFLKEFGGCGRCGRLYTAHRDFERADIENLPSFKTFVEGKKAELKQENSGFEDYEKQFADKSDDQRGFDITD